MHLDHAFKLHTVCFIWDDQNIWCFPDSTHQSSMKVKEMHPGKILNDAMNSSPTNFSTGLDNLADPTEAIAESQNLAANVFDAEKTWYLINGTTAGLQVCYIYWHLGKFLHWMASKYLSGLHFCDILCCIESGTLSSEAVSPLWTAWRRLKASSPFISTTKQRNLESIADLSLIECIRQRLSVSWHCSSCCVASISSQMLAWRLISVSNFSRHSTSFTAALQAALLATCPSKSVVVARNCHISVFNALVLAGARPRWIQPEVCPHSQVALHVTVTSLELALEEEIQARHKPCAVVVVSPTYYGIVSDVEGRPLSLWKTLFSTEHLKKKKIRAHSALKTSWSLNPYRAAIWRDPYSWYCNLRLFLFLSLCIIMIWVLSPGYISKSSLPQVLPSAAISMVFLWLWTKLMVLILACILAFQTQQCSKVLISQCNPRTKPWHPWASLPCCIVKVLW